MFMIVYHNTTKLIVSVCMHVKMVWVRFKAEFQKLVFGATSFRVVHFQRCGNSSRALATHSILSCYALGQVYTLTNLCMIWHTHCVRLVPQRESM